MKKERVKRAVLCYALTVLLFGMTLSVTVTGVSALDLNNSRTYNGWFTSEPSADTEPETEQQESSQSPHSEENSQNNETEKSTSKNTEKPTQSKTTTVKQNNTSKNEATTSSKVSPKTTSRRTDSAAPAQADASYTVTFNANGGTPVKSQTVKDGATLAKPSDPKRDGFKFEGWFKDTELKKPVNFSTDRVAGNVTVYAKWTPLAGTVTHDIFFSTVEGGGFVTANPAQAVAGESIMLTIVPDEGMIIKAGSLKVNGTATDKLSFVMPDTDVTISAEFETAPVYEAEGGGISKTVIIAVIAVIVVVATLVVITLAMREKPMNETEPDWRDHSIVISDFKKKKTDIMADPQNTSDGETDSTDKTE